jgi:hypothetical protein
LAVSFGEEDMFVIRSSVAAAGFNLVGGSSWLISESGIEQLRCPNKVSQCCRHGMR